MNARFLFTFVCVSLAVASRGQPSSSIQTVTTPPQDTPYAVVDRDANSSVWERTTYELSPSGEWVPQIHSYTEIAAGLHYKDENGNWADSIEAITPLTDGSFEALQGRHQAYFPANIYTGVVDLVIPDGQHLKSRPLGISYFDGTNSVLVAELTNSVGQLISSNQLIYTNAFMGVTADILLTYRKSGLECDLVFRSQVPAPDVFGMNPANLGTRMELLTEFFDNPTPQVTAATVSPVSGLRDSTLDFGSMKMIRGKAFQIPAQNEPPQSSSRSIPVYKTWTQLEGRTLLIEELPYKKIGTFLQTLPLLQAAGASVSMDSVLRRVSPVRLLPPTRIVAGRSRPSPVAHGASRPVQQISKAGAKEKPGVVWDYNIVTSDQTNVTFKGDTTYYVSGECDLFGTTIFEGGTVIKFTNSFGTTLYLEANWICDTAPYGLAVFTCKDDNIVGEKISGSSGSPTQTGDQYINGDGVNGLLKYVRMCYAGYGIYGNFDEQYGGGVWNCQFVNCGTAVVGEDYTDVYLRNDLFSRCGTVVSEASIPEFPAFLNAQQVTADQVGTFYDAGSYAANLTNCILTAVTNLASSFTLDHCATNASGGGIYQTAGSGSYYLSANSTNREAGTTNILLSLLTELQQRTTYPPIVYSNITITTNIELAPQAGRDTNTPDLGYHYDPLDWCFGGVETISNITFDPGTAVGWFELPGSGGPGFGIAVAGAGSLNFNGLVNTPCTLARYETVQEGGNGLWQDKGWLAAVTTDASNPNLTTTTAQFTRFMELATDPNEFSDYYSEVGVVANHCEFWSGNCIAYWSEYLFTNCLFDRIDMGIHGDSPSVFAMRNCTMHGGWLDIEHWSGTTWPVWIENCAFDASTVYSMDDNSGGDTNNTYCDYNGFLNGAQRLVIQGSNDVVTNVFNWQPGPLGSYYQPSNSLMINRGSVTADVVGLYNFTTQTNQTEEEHSIVDIGYHYLALDSNGHVLDNDSDGVPDWEDANPNDPNVGILNVIIDSPLNGTIFN